MAAQIDWTAFQNAMANGLAQGFAQQAPVAAATASTSKKSSVAKPDEYDGTSSKYEKFIRQVELYVLANRTQFPDDNSKILFVLSYMTEGLADQ
jgi:hypothetical protein